ncbi:MAG: cell envelope integrity EipB family protein [Hyphomicrobiales bacterium]|nr:cell envelope integrity EipB family protein [Hyphomicrobiales bacterium]
MSSLWSSRSLLASVVFLLAGVCAADAAPAGPVFAGHRAVYEMRLADRTDRSEVAAASGRLVYEFSGSVCEGWASRFRMVTRLDPTEGASRLTDLRTTNFEAGDGKSFDFVNETRLDGAVTEESKGHAVRDGESIRVHLDRPEEKDVVLPAAVRFPTAHMREIVALAEAGKSFAEIDLYDGSDRGEKTYRTSIAIGREASEPDDAEPDEPAARSDLLAGHRRWPVEIAFFDLAAKSAGEATPDYQLRFLLYDNGVSRRMRFDYGSFVLRADLSSLEALPAASCP